MQDVLMVAPPGAKYTQQSPNAAGSFDVTLYGRLLDADIGHALTGADEPLQRETAEDVEEEVLEEGRSPTVGYHEAFLVTSDEPLTGNVKLRTGEIVSVADYDVVLVTQVVYHAYYIWYLTRKYPDTTLVGVQDESLRDVMHFSSRLQTIHFQGLKGLDGFIVEDETYEEWVSGILDDVLFVPLLVPEGQFDHVQFTKSRDAVCIGSSTYNHEMSNFYSSIRTVENLRDEGHRMSGELLGVASWQADELFEFAENYEWIETYEFMDDGFYEHLAGLQFAIVLTERVSAGRIAAEFAGVGVPCIGTEKNDLQSRCFPALAVPPHDVDAATWLARRLLTDQAFYDRVVEDGRRAVSKLQRHHSHRNRLSEFLCRCHDGAKGGP